MTQSLPAAMTKTPKNLTKKIENETENVVQKRQHKYPPLLNTLTQKDALLTEPKDFRNFEVPETGG